FGAKPATIGSNAYQSRERSSCPKNWNLSRFSCLHIVVLAPHVSRRSMFTHKISVLPAFMAFWVVHILVPLNASGDLSGSSGEETLAAESPRSIRFPGRP